MSRPSVDEDRRTIARVVSGDRAALEQVYSRFGGTLFRYLVTLTSDRQIAEEVLQDTLVAVWRSAATYGGRSSVRSWLFGIARRQAHNTLRGHPLKSIGDAGLETLPDSDPSPEESLLDEARREDLLDRMGRLARIHREVLALVFFHELSYEETAEVLEVPIGTVRSRLFNAKRALRTLLQVSEEREK